MLKDMLSIFTDRADFFWELLLEHLEIALVSILIAILFGGLVGILISEFPKAARPALGGRNTHTGVTNVDPSILEAAKGMGSTKAQILFKIKLPLAMPVIMSHWRKWHNYFTHAICRNPDYHG